MHRARGRTEEFLELLIHLQTTVLTVCAKVLARVQMNVHASIKFHEFCART